MAVAERRRVGRRACAARKVTKDGGHDVGVQRREEEVDHIVRLRQMRAKVTPRLEELLLAERHSLNSSEDCAFSEALALANVLPTCHSGGVIAERDLVRVCGYDMAPGTPDGAVTIAEGLFAVQVVRHAPGRRRGCASLLRVVLEKVAKSLRWILASNNRATTFIATFVIAVWVPAPLSARALGSLRRALRRSDATRETCFEFVLLVSPDGFRDALFPTFFGKHRSPAKRPLSTRGLAAKINQLKAALNDDADDTDTLGDSALGCLADLLHDSAP